MMILEGTAMGNVVENAMIGIGTDGGMIARDLNGQHITRMKIEIETEMDITGGGGGVALVLRNHEVEMSLSF